MTSAVDPANPASLPLLTCSTSCDHIATCKPLTGIHGSLLGGPSTLPCEWIRKRQAQRDPKTPSRSSATIGKYVNRMCKSVYRGYRLSLLRSKLPKSASDIVPPTAQIREHLLSSHTGSLPKRGVKPVRTNPSPPSPCPKGFSRLHPIGNSKSAYQTVQIS